MKPPLLELPCSAHLVIPAPKGRFVVVQENRGATPAIWGLPGGKLKKGEEPHDAALREAWEETGLSGLSVEGLGGICLTGKPRGNAVSDLRVHYLFKGCTDTSLEGLMDGVRTCKPKELKQWGKNGRFKHPLFHKVIRYCLDTPGEDLNDVTEFDIVCGFTSLKNGCPPHIQAGP